MGRPRATEIKKALSDNIDQRHSSMFFEVKNGSTWFNKELLIMDALEIKKSWKNPCFTGYEIKVSRSDFLRDEKWPGYLENCHKFYFVCPRGLISREEIEAMDGNVGLMYYHKDYATSFHTMKAPVYQNIGIPNRDILYYIIMSKLNSDRYPFFSTKKEYFQAWLENKIENTELGWLVEGQLGRTIGEQELEIKSLREHIDKYNEKAKAVDEVLKYLGDKGLTGWYKHELRDDWKEKLDEIFESSLNDIDKNRIKEAIKAVENLKKVVENGE